jgi:hypothetical protein
VLICRQRRNDDLGGLAAFRLRFRSAWTGLWVSLAPVVPAGSESARRGRVYPAFPEGLVIL